jgi:hypothetical protein
MTDKNLQAEDIIMLTKKEFKEILDILKMLLDFYISKQ